MNGVVGINGHDLGTQALNRRLGTHVALNLGSREDCQESYGREEKKDCRLEQSKSPAQEAAVVAGRPAKCRQSS
ncbi:MAG: hypothetical protein Kow00109_05240 [Acidobacteriota bacterium]